MTFIMEAGSSPTRPHEGLQVTRIGRDLAQIASLVEVCFAGRLDVQGRAAIQEMRAFGSLGLLLWPLGLLDRIGLGMSMGYVWRDRGKVVGNVSLYRAGPHPELGPGWFIANVATHPDYRRQGIARRMMEATIEQARRFRGRWVSLQVENNNLGAVELYQSLGFERFEVVEQWHASNLNAVEAPSPAPREWVIRRRGMDEISPEMDLLFKRARQGGMAWTRPFERGDFSDPALNMLGGLPGGRFRERWLIQRVDKPSHWMGIIWNQSGSWSKAALCAFFDPALEDSLKAALLKTVLSPSGMSGRVVKLETSREGEWQESLLREAGFRRERALVLMRRLIRTYP